MNALHEVFGGAFEVQVKVDSMLIMKSVDSIVRVEPLSTLK
jgi:hypothetical protein